MLERESSVKLSDGQKKSSDTESSAIIERIVDFIFGDSVLQSCFLSGVSSVVKLMTLQVSKLAKMLDLSDFPRARNTMLFYVKKISQSLSECESADDEMEIFGDGSLMAAVDGFLCYFTVPVLVKLTQNLLSRLHEMKDSPEFEQYKDLLTNILSSLSAQDNAGAQLPLCSMNRIFSFLPSMNNDHFLEICLSLVKQKPHYALAAKPVILEYLLQNSGQATSELSAKLVSHNPMLHRHFGKWLASASCLECDQQIQPCLSWVLTTLSIGKYHGSNNTDFCSFCFWLVQLLVYLKTK